MAGAKGSALDWALALLQAPGERHALRARPLPPGIEEVLAIAGGAVPSQVARSSGASEARLRDAAQFFVREAMFFPQADAYRTLGVARDAPAEQIKAHHRLLQHWLHPDRLQGDDDAVFAGRVNSAWNRLRTPERRAAYDEALRQQRPPELFDSRGNLRALPAWEPMVSTPTPLERWRHRVPGVLLSLTCVVLAVMVLRDMQSRPDTWEGEERPPLGRLAEDLDIRAPTPSSPAPDIARPVALARPERVPSRRNPVAATTATPLITGAMPAATAMAGPAPLPEPLQAPFPAHAPVAAQAAEPDRPALVQASAPPPVAQAAPKPKAGPGTPVPSFDRLQSAQQVGEQLLRYMASVNRPPPAIWNSPAIQSSAEQLRRDLHDLGKADLTKPRWRIGNEAAVLTAGYRAGTAAAGRLTADLVWREGQWLVTGLSMERDQ